MSEKVKEAGVDCLGLKLDEIGVLKSFQCLQGLWDLSMDGPHKFRYTVGTSSFGSRCSTNVDRVKTTMSLS